MGLNQNNLRSCLIWRATDQTITTGTATAVSFSTSIRNPHSLAEFTTHPTRITINRSGLYYVHACVKWAAGATGLRTLQVQRNGTANDFPIEQSQAAPASGVGLQSLGGLVYLVNGDYIELVVTHSQEADLAVSADTTAFLPKFGVALVDPDYDGSAAAEAI